MNKRSEQTTFTLSATPGDDLTYVFARSQVSLPSLASERVPVFVLGPNDGKLRQVRVRVNDGKQPRAVQGGVRSASLRGA